MLLYCEDLFGRCDMKLIVCACIALFFLVTIHILYELKNIEVTHINIESEKKVNIRIALVSDLHNFNYKGKKKLSLIILKEKVDVVCIPGDCVVADKCRYENFLEFVKELQEINIPVIMSFGNHELKLKKNFEDKFEDFQKKLEKFDVKVLDNSSIIFDNVCFIGYTNPLKQYSKFKKTYKLDLDELLLELQACPDREEYKILLAHNPIYFDVYQKWGADLVLSGHLHGGIVRLPFVGGVLSPQTFFRGKYDAGEYRINKSKMYVSRGLGVHSIPIRFMNRPEISIIEITGNN